MYQNLLNTCQFPSTCTLHMNFELFYAKLQKHNGIEVPHCLKYCVARSDVLYNSNRFEVAISCGMHVTQAAAGRSGEEECDRLSFALKNVLLRNRGKGWEGGEKKGF